jgi:hypothetical protein
MCRKLYWNLLFIQNVIRSAFPGAPSQDIHFLFLLSFPTRLYSSAPLCKSLAQQHPLYCFRPFYLLMLFLLRTGDDPMVSKGRDKEDVLPDNEPSAHQVHRGEIKFNFGYPQNRLLVKRLTCACPFRTKTLAVLFNPLMLAFLLTDPCQAANQPGEGASADSWRGGRGGGQSRGR